MDLEGEEEPEAALGQYCATTWSTVPKMEAAAVLELTCTHGRAAGGPSLPPARGRRRPGRRRKR